MVYEKESYVAGSMCDPQLKLSVIAALELIEDSVTELLGGMGIDGVTAMNKYGAMWVFSKNNMQIMRRPKWLEKLHVRCYISKHSPLRIFVDTEIGSADGEAFVRSRVEICALDLETGHIRKPVTLGFTEDMEKPEPMPGLDFSRFSKEGTSPVSSVTVRSTNLDYCSHTNNVEYVRFILDTFTSKELQSREIAGLELHYLGQSYEGETLDIGRITGEGSDTYFISRGDEAAVACRIGWA